MPDPPNTPARRNRGNRNNAATPCFETIVKGKRPWVRNPAANDIIHDFPQHPESKNKEIRPMSPFLYRPQPSSLKHAE